MKTKFSLVRTLRASPHTPASDLEDAGRIQDPGVMVANIRRYLRERGRHKTNNYRSSEHDPRMTD